MKTLFVRRIFQSSCIIPGLGWFLSLAPSAVAAQPESVIVERGPHHRVIERTVNGRKSSYIELASGLHFKNQLGEWVESKAEIEIFQGAATARQVSTKLSSQPISIRLELLICWLPTASGFAAMCWAWLTATLPAARA
jgi:hypothetical protein